MRSLSRRESRLLLIISAAVFLLLNFLGYQQLAQRRTRALASQRTYKMDLTRLRELQAAKPAADVNSHWLETRLPAYKDVDQFETYLFNIVTNRAAAAGDIELTKKDPRPTWSRSSSFSIPCKIAKPSGSSVSWNSRRPRMKNGSAARPASSNGGGPTAPRSMGSLRPTCRSCPICPPPTLLPPPPLRRLNRAGPMQSKPLPARTRPQIPPLFEPTTPN
jgi:hypothetical protein